jgi:hypothetical protein
MRERPPNLTQKSSMDIIDSLRPDFELLVHEIAFPAACHQAAGSERQHHSQAC